MTAPALFAPPAYPDDFEEEFKAFGKAVHKHAAFLEHRRLKKAGQLPGHQELLAAIAAQHESERWRVGVQPDFRTWLHQHRWEDDPAALTWGRNGNGRDAAPAGVPESIRRRWPYMEKWERAIVMENLAMGAFR